MRELLDNLVEECRQYTGNGNLASYIPELLKYNKDDLGIYLIRNDGKEFFAGNHDRVFTIQSVCKPLILLLALIDNGEDFIRERIGVESTGKPFNAIMDFTQGQELREHINPMVNIGAIAMCSMICGMYDGAGDFATRVGVPAKSGVGGGILSVAPTMMGIGIYGPSLDARGNSYAGIKPQRSVTRPLRLYFI